MALRRLNQVVVVAVGFFIACAALAESRPGFLVLDVVIDKPIFDQICLLLRLDDQERVIATQLHQEYLACVNVIDARAYERLQDSGGREIDESHEEFKRNRAAENTIEGRNATFRQFRDKQDLLSDEYAGKLAQVRQSACLKADQQLASFCASLDQNIRRNGEMLARVPRLVRRMNRLARYDTAIYDELNQPIDLFDVIAKAAKPEQELAWLQLAEELPGLSLLVEEPPLDDQIPEVVKEGRAALREILNEYELSVDAALVQNLDDQRRPLRSNEPLSIRSDDPGFDLYMRKHGQKWAQRFNPLWGACNNIEFMLAHLQSPQIARSWRDRVNRLVCPSLTGTRWPASLHGWLLALELTDEQRTTIELLLDQHDVERARLETLAIEAGIRVKKARLVVNFEQQSPEDLDFAQAKLAIHRLTVNTYKHTVACLNSEHALQFNRKLFGMALNEYDPIQFGPRIDWAPLTSLGLWDEYSGAWRKVPTKIPS